MYTSVVVILSSYNGEKYISEQLDSLIAQEQVDIKILIRDDGSKDATWDILEKYQKQYPNLIFLVKGENIGYAQSFTMLLNDAITRFPNVRYFAFCDQDDVWLAKKLKIATDVLNEEDDSIPVAYCSNTTIVDEQLKIIGKCWNPKKVEITKERAMIQSFATGCTMAFNRVAAEIYVSHLPKVIKVHDYLMYQICVFLGKVIWDEDSYILYRQHGKNQIGKKDFKSRMRARCSGHYKEHALEYQNRCFLEAFKDMLTIEDISLLSRMVYYRTNIFTRLSLLFSNKISYTSAESDFFYRLKILLGGV